MCAPRCVFLLDDLNGACGAVLGGFPARSPVMVEPAPPWCTQPSFAFKWRNIQRVWEVIGERFMRAGTRVTFEHTGFPDDQAEHLSKGWHADYWERLRKLLA